MLGEALPESKAKLNICRSFLVTERCSLERVPRAKAIIYALPWQRFCVSRAPAAGIFRDFFSRDLIGLNNCRCVGLSLHMPTQLGFISGLMLLAAKRVENIGTEHQGRPPLGRAMAWPYPLACEVRSGALCGTSRSSPHARAKATK